MKITELSKPESITLGISASSKEDAINQLVALMEKGGGLNDKAGYKEGILAREALGSTAVGEEIVIPRAKVAAVKEPGLAAAVVPEGMDYEAFDDSLANLIFIVAAPEGEANTHLEALSRLSTLLMVPGFKDSLIVVKSKKEFLIIIDKAKKERFGKTEEAKAGNADSAASAAGDKTAGNAGGASKIGNAATADSKNTFTGSGAAGYRILAVTVCPTGIAHTFMAAKNLENMGKKLGIPVKAETSDSDGAQNVLTKEEITSADAIIIAADKNVEMARFDGKPVIMASVSESIHKGEELVQKAVNGTVPIYHHAGGSDGGEVSGSNDSVGRTIYKHLMNGVSHMLPFVIGGGILIALAFLFDNYAINPANFGKNTPLAAYLKTIGEQVFDTMLPVLTGYIAMSIADCPGLAVGSVDGLVAKMGCTFANPAGGDVNTGFLGTLFAGFVDGYIIVLLRKCFSKLPKSLEGIKPVLLYPMLGIFLVGVATTFISPYVGMINDVLSGALNGMGGTNRTVLGMVTAGMMSMDMGGPVNKAAYVFGTAQLAKGDFEVMAAVMAGGMVPPIAIALCTTLFKNRFSERDRQSSLVNYIMGLPFISEGAIPFAAADPLRMIPSYVIGSAVAGGLSMFFDCTLRVPHGGIFVLPTIGNPFAYLVAVLVGPAVECVIPAMLKKPYQV